MRTSFLALPAFVAATAAAQSPRTIRYPAIAPNAIVSLTKPVLTIAQDNCELNGVNSIVMQASGGIVLSNAGDRQLCYFDSRGRFLKKAGRRGAGPGEFENMRDVGLYRGDSVVVTDPTQRRVSIFGPAGETGRQFLLQSPDTLGNPLRTLALLSGEILLSFAEIKTMAPQKDAVTLYQQFVRATAAGATGSRVVRLVQGEHFVQALRPEDGMGSTAYWNLQWGRSTSISSTASGFIAGDGGDNIVREYDAAGQVRILHVVPLDRRPVTPELIALFKEVELKTAKPERRALTERYVNEMPYPRDLPAYNAVIADHTGPIWVQSYPDSTGSYWLRLDPMTASTKAFRFPAKFRLYAVRADHACGVGRDEDDLQTVYCFTIPR